ncbi:hypothetical protein EGH21_22605 [Halomicroarcula sp. F13]|uniref:Uncharacterized protein n=1 Tax=Haloarcula rubra TaxID=2487747 RepID=A0AAW4Q003_9EURY|nr:hypothetical protein [Halomicroarcula rubra]MBX0325813.1 hypothetical protein [Halomicroarcula rubra]
MTETIPLTATDDVTTGELLKSVVDEVTTADTQSALTNNYAPTAGRVAEVTSTGTVYVGDGSAWQTAASLVGLESNHVWRRAGPATANTSVSDQGIIQAVDTSGGTVTVTLASAMVEDGAEIIVKDEAGNAGTNAITVDTEGSESIDGSASATIGSNYGVLRLYSDGTDWYTR